MIEVKHLTKQYGDKLAVNDISFTVEDGEILGLLGPNGAGKSTVIDALQIVLLGETNARNFNLAANERSQRDQGKGTDRLSAGAAAAVPGYDRHGLSELCL